MTKQARIFCSETEIINRDIRSASLNKKPRRDPHEGHNSLANLNSSGGDSFGSYDQYLIFAESVRVPVSFVRGHNRT